MLVKKVFWHDHNRVPGGGRRFNERNAWITWSVFCPELRMTRIRPERHFPTRVKAAEPTSQSELLRHSKPEGRFWPVDRQPPLIGSRIDRDR